MKFPALSREEKAFFASGMDDSNILNSFSERVQDSMTACLGLPVRVHRVQAVQPARSGTGKAPKIVASQEIRDAWTAARFGGRPGSGGNTSAALSGSLDRLVLRALAESVFNLGSAVAWPEAFMLELNIQGQEGTLECFCEPRFLMRWAKAELERTR